LTQTKTEFKLNCSHLAEGEVILESWRACQHASYARYVDDFKCKCVDCDDITYSTDSRMCGEKEEIKFNEIELGFRGPLSGITGKRSIHGMCVTAYEECF
jgi:hypothetical protein